MQNLEEKINILKDQNLQESKSRYALEEKIRRYSSLKVIIEEINQELEIDATAGSLVNIVFSLVGNSKGTCIFYLIDQQSQKLSLFKTRKEDKRLVIKAKEGDMFDLWVLRHISPLLIENVKRDFRFDLEFIKPQELRPISSLISSPLVTENSFVGVLRLDNNDPAVYSQDDLRLLVTISDLGAVAIENGELFQKTQDLAIHDGLTGLFTKGYFLDRLKEQCKRTLRQKEKFSLLMLDIDYFKKYNDRFGHTAGDIVLKSISASISEFLKEANPIICRFGGEEFCIILPRKDKKEADLLAEGLLKKVEETKVVLRRQETNITVSIGVATFPEDAGSEDELILKADKAMYLAKQNGRNRVTNA